MNVTCFKQPEITSVKKELTVHSSLFNKNNKHYKTTNLIYKI